MKRYTLILLLILTIPFGCRHNPHSDAEIYKETAVVEDRPIKEPIDTNRASSNVTLPTTVDSTKLSELKENHNNLLAIWLEKALQDTLSRNEGDPQLDFSKYELHMRDTITGDFDGDGRLEMAHRFKYYEYPNWDGSGVSADGVVFSDTNIPFFIVSQPFLVELMLNERDLMGDHSDEIGFSARGAFSGWGVWVVYSYIDGKWTEIVNFSYNSNFDDYPKSSPLNRKDLVMLDPNDENYIIVKELKTENGEFVRKTRSVKIR